VSSAAILFSTSSTRLLHRISTAGGPAIRALEPEHGVVQNWPSMLPDGNHFLYLAAGSGARDELRVGSLETGTSKALMEATSMGVYAAGHVLFIRNRELLAQRLDEEALTLVGEPVPLVQGVAFNRANGRAAFDASRSGTLIYRSGANDLSWTMRWVDRQGKRVGALATAGMLVGPSLSPDGRRVAMTRLDGGGGDIWIENTSTGSQTNLTLDPTNQHWSPVWSPDGERVAYRARRGNSSALYAKMASGVGDAVLLSEQSIATSPMSWSPDGKHLLFMSIDPVTSWDIWVVSVVDGKAWPVANGPFNEGHPQFSPDGRWIAYSSNEFGDNQVFVQSFPPGRGKWQVAGVAGAFPRWRQDGGELLFLSGSFAVNAAVMSSAVAQVGDALQLAPARDVIRVGPLQTGPVVGVGNFLPWAISPDGQRFLVPQFEAGTAPERPQVTVVVNARALTNVR
jgi:serine/threonine-protein kinase